VCATALFARRLRASSTVGAVSRSTPHLQKRATGTGTCPPTSRLRLPTPRCVNPKSLVVLGGIEVADPRLFPFFSAGVAIHRRRSYANHRRFYPVRARHAVSSQPVPSVPHSSLYEPIDFAAADLLFEPCASSRRGRCVSTCDSTDRPSSRPSPESSSAQWFSQASPVAPDAPRASQPASASIDALSAHAGCVRRSASAASRARHSRFLGVAAAKAKRRGTRFNGPPTGTSAISMRQPS
jgi:hypothetical protein